MGISKGSPFVKACCKFYGGLILRAVEMSVGFMRGVGKDNPIVKPYRKFELAPYIAPITRR